MNMNFTEDPDWIAQRQALWKDCLENRSWEEELSQKQLRGLHTYFMTGNLVPGAPRAIEERIFFFPRVDIEGIQHVLKYNIPEGATDKDVSDLKLFFSTGIASVPGLPNEEAAEIFRYVYGDSYQPDWQLPFLIDDESTNRQSPLDPNHQFECGVWSLWWLNGKYDDKGMWTHLKDYWLSLLPFVDPILFRPGDRSHRPPNVMINITPKNFRQFLGFCAHGIDISEGQDWGEDRRQFMCDIRSHIESLDGPPDLMHLWDNVRQADTSEFLIYR